MNLWSFSNSGAGASCSIDRVPNELLRRLALLRKRHKGELARILNTPALSSSFLECLSDNREWSGLYPAKNMKGLVWGFRVLLESHSSREKDCNGPVYFWPDNEI